MVTDQDITDMEDTMEKHLDSWQPQMDARIDVLETIDAMWKALIKFWWFFIVIISILSTASYFYAQKNYVPQYTAYSTFTVKAVSVYGYNEENYNMATAAQLGDVFPYLLTNGVLTEKVAEDLGTNRVNGKITATALENTNMITLTVVAKDGQLAYDILQSVIRNYTEISNPVIGEVTLRLLDESGVPEVPTNLLNPRRTAFISAAAAAALCILYLLIYALARKTVNSEEEYTHLLSPGLITFISIR